MPEFCYRHAMRSRLLATLVILAAAACSGGCLKRTISVTTEPPGALVWINDVEVGRTPLQTDFTFYGEYDVRLRREGFEPIIASAKADTPIQEFPGIDLLAEAAPVRFHTIVRWHWDLVPLAENAMPKEQGEQALIARANELRSGIVAAAPPGPAPAKPEPAKIEPKQIEPKPAEPKHVEPKPTEPKPIQPKPAEPKPPEPAPPAPKKPVDDGLRWIKGLPLKPTSDTPPAAAPKN
jgi:hypothetical protein